MERSEKSGEESSSNRSRQSREQGEDEIDMTGAVKIIDGLFVGDKIASEDLDFLISNKITHVINCAAGDLPSLFAKYNIKYLNISCTPNKPFESSTELTEDAFRFIEGAFTNFEGVLIHSRDGQGLACVAATLYFIKKFGWAVLRTLEFLNASRPGLELQPSVIKQILAFEKRL